MSHAHFIARRKRLLEAIGDGVAIVPTAPEVIRNRDAHHPYRFDSYFWYLTGFPEPEAVVVLIGGKKPKSILFCREKHEEREIWDGYRYGPKAAKTAFGFDAAYPIGQLDKKLAEFLVNRDTLWHAIGHDAEWDTRIARALNEVRAQTRAGKRAPRAIHDLRAELDAMRLVKDAPRPTIQQRSADIASAGHARAMRACRPGMAEYELEAELTYEFRKRGADGHAYTPIVAGGANACVLHYVANDKLLNDHALVLIDAGCEVEGYAADITRTFPVNGRFNAAQKDVYEIVLAAQDAAVAATAPGRHFMEGHDAAVRVLTQGMIDLKLLNGDVDNADREGRLQALLHAPHRPLARPRRARRRRIQGRRRMDDAATGNDADRRTRPLHSPGRRCPAWTGGHRHPHRGRCARYATGCHIYTTAPKTVAEIEEVMRHD